jgi:hypothetical protein
VCVFLFCLLQTFIFLPALLQLVVLKQKKKKIHIAKQTLAMADRQNARTAILCKRVSEFLTSLGHRHTSLVAPRLEELFSFVKHTLSCSSSSSSSSSPFVFLHRWVFS